MHSRRLLTYALRQWRFLLAILLLTLLSSAAAALQPWPMKLLVDHALKGEELRGGAAGFFARFGWEPSPASLIVFAAVASVCVFALSSALHVAMSLCWNVGGQRMVYDLAGDLFAKLQRLSLQFHSRRNVGDSLSRLTDDTWCIYTVTDGLLMAPVQHLFTLVVMTCVGFALDPLLCVIILAVAPLLAWSSSYFGNRLKQRSRLGREAKSQLTSFVHQILGAIPLVQTFGSEERNTRRFRDLANDNVALAQKGALVSSSYGLVNGLITTSGMAAVLYVGGIRVMHGAIPLGTLLVFLVYVRQMQDASSGLFKIFAQLKNAEASVDRIMEVLESKESIAEPLRPVSLSHRPRDQKGHIRFENVIFEYEANRPVLDQVCLEARAGEVIALVGPSGAGKSTLVAMIPRFFDPRAGRITLDGVDIRHVALAELREQISIVLQEPLLMPQSIADNIAYGRRGASREEIIVAAVAAQADEFIRCLPRGYDTLIGESGATLSGGERQRLSIARALLKDAPVLILDEPTSALDMHTERALIRAIGSLMQGRTTFVIAHRLSTVRHANRIAVLEQGRLVQFGTHAEMINVPGLYQQLYECQFSVKRNEALA